MSALVGAIHYGSGLLGAGLVGAFADGTPWPVGWVDAEVANGECASTSELIPTAIRTLQSRDKGKTAVRATSATRPLHGTGGV